MAKLYFYYSAMNAGKSTVLLQSAHNYQERGMDTLLFTPAIDTRYGEGQISSRIGLSASAIMFDDSMNLHDFIKTQINKNPNISCALFDEAQFLTNAQVQQLCRVTVDCGIPVLTYGIRTDFRGEVFPGSLALLALADELIEIKTICHCGSKATMNVRINAEGQAVSEGSQVEIGGNDRYVATCRKHFYEGITQRQQDKEITAHESDL